MSTIDAIAIRTLPDQLSNPLVALCSFNYFLRIIRLIGKKVGIVLQIIHFLLRGRRASTIKRENLEIRDLVGINENHAGKGDGTVARPYLEGDRCEEFTYSEDRLNVFE